MREGDEVVGVWARHCALLLCPHCRVVILYCHHVVVVHHCCMWLLDTINNDDER